MDEYQVGILILLWNSTSELMAEQTDQLKCEIHIIDMAAKFWIEAENVQILQYNGSLESLIN